MARRRDRLFGASRRAASRIARSLAPIPTAVREAARILAEGVAEPDEAPETTPEPQQPVAPPPPPPPVIEEELEEPPGPEPVPEADEPPSVQTLMGDLVNFASAQKEVADRLRQLGYGQTADAIIRDALGVKGPSPEDRGAVSARPPQAPPPRPQPTPPPVPPVPEPPPPAPVPPPVEPQPEVPEQDEVPPQDQTPPAPPQKGVSPILQGSIINIPMIHNLEDLFRVLKEVWEKAMIGSPREPAASGEIDSLGRPRGQATDDLPPYAPDALMRGSTVDEGRRIPPEVLRSPDSFVGWAKENGFGKGASITIDGLVPPPGGVITGKKSWTPDISFIGDRGAVPPVDSDGDTEG